MTRPDPNSFLSGDGGDVTDPWRRAKRTAGELAYGAIDAVTATRLRAARLARTTRAPLDVLVIGVYRDGAFAGRRVTRSSIRSPQRALRARRDGCSGSATARVDGRGRAHRGKVREPEPGAGGGRRARARLDHRRRRRRPAPARVPRPLPRRLRGVRARSGAARPDAPQPLGLEGHAAATGVAGPRDPLRRDRARDRLRPARRRRAAALPRASVRLGARPALGRARRPARLAARRGGRAARPPRVRARGATYRATTPSRRPRASSPTAPTSRAPGPARCSPPTGGRAADVRLLFVCPDMRFGGAERHWATLIVALAELGVEPKLLAPRREGAFFDDVASRGIPAECMDLRRRIDPRGLRRTLAVAAAFRPDAVVTRGVSAQLVGEAIARRARAVHVTTSTRRSRPAAGCSRRGRISERSCGWWRARSTRWSR